MVNKAMYYCSLDEHGKSCPFKNSCRRYVDIKRIPKEELCTARLFNICERENYSMRIICEEEKKLIEHGGIDVILGNKAEAFVSLCNKYEGNVDVYQKQTVLDGKSNVGVLSLALEEPVTVEYIGEEDTAIEFYKELEELCND